MMLRTCTVQVNLDFGDEADMVEKLRVCLALQPLATALFGNSPISEGKKNGYRSLRARVWTDTDPDRTGIPAVVFEDGFGFERFAEWVLDVPMYFIMRDGQWLDAAGQSFRAFLNGKAEKLAGLSATMGDWADHVTTVFTDVRLKRFLEMRGADAGAPSMLNALPAFWVGLIYDDAAQKAAAAASDAARLSAMARGARPMYSRQSKTRGSMCAASSLSTASARAATPLSNTAPSPAPCLVSASHLLASAGLCWPLSASEGLCWPPSASDCLLSASPRRKRAERRRT
jgi:glutamate--cysteine ligase